MSERLSQTIINKYLIGKTNNYPGEYPHNWHFTALDLIGELEDELDDIEAKLKAMQADLDQIAENALWHDEIDDPEALDNIRTLLKLRGYNQVGILAAAWYELL